LLSLDIVFEVFFRRRGFTVSLRKTNGCEGTYVKFSGFG